MSLVAQFATVGTASSEEVLRVVLASNVGALDPIATTSYATRTFAYMVYDVLISVDLDGVYRPQMLEKWDVSEDGALYTFTLRDQLTFNDGTPVTSKDVVASISRWWQVDSFGKRLHDATAELVAVDDNVFTLRLSRPFGHVIEALGKPSSNLPVIMPARLAESTPPREPVAEIIGSGPYTFDWATWNPGSTVTLVKRDDYVARDEPASGFAGGKVPAMDRIEIINMPDPATQVSALQQGEIDFIEMVPQDYIDLLTADASVVMQSFTGANKTMGATVINHMNPPFNDIKVRRALQALGIHEEYMTGLGLKPDVWVHDCTSFFMCGSAYGSTAGNDMLPEESVENAKKLLAESGYNGELVRILHASTTNDINLMGLVLFGLMQQAGFNVELASSDWPTVANARWNKATVEEGGWSLMQVTWGGEDLGSPFTNYTIANNCSEGYAGWACEPRITELVSAFEAETDIGKRQEITADIQRLAFENVQFLIQGQYSRTQAYRADIEGLQPQNSPVFWQVTRKK
ncbi:ABC transporter substrate-binding protein [Hoeflea alexandrii]|nr:ABC transporter substrate-binding protein [Hoeflea alexandrii]